MLTFLAPWFATIGIIAAAGPVLIHLLNRRRFRTVRWAAMDFLKQALQRNRRLLQWRDWLLLLLRTVCVVLFCLAMARPYWSSSDEKQDPNQPVHAVLIIDNSLSMGYTELNTSLLDDAKAKATDFIKSLPRESRVTILPLCGSSGRISRDPYRSADDAVDALALLEVVDQQGSMLLGADMALAACNQEQELSAKRIAFIGDQQRVSWPPEGAGSHFKNLPDLQVVPINASNPSNTWGSECRVRDGIADVETETVFVIQVHHAGDEPRPDVEVTVTLNQEDGGDDKILFSRTIDLAPRQTREITFPYHFDVGDVPVEPGEPSYQAVTVSLTPDKLPQDDSRFLSVPVVAALPVVFVDQHGEENEEPDKNKYGDTFLLRRLLAPINQRGDVLRQLVTIRHVDVNALALEGKDLLQDARLVVMAGVENPGPAVPLLREYVEQGGQLVIAAGDGFAPDAWNREGWRDGEGILPALLKIEPVGKLPEEDVAGEHQFFRLDYNTMVHDFFQLEDAEPEFLKDFYEQPFFFKAVAAELTDEVKQTVFDVERDRIVEKRKFIAETREKISELENKEAQQGVLPEEDAEELNRLRRELGERLPDWVLWARGREADRETIKPEELADQSRPRLLAAFNNKTPYLVERKIGRGSVMWVGSGVYGGWNTLMKFSDSVVMFDRILRGMLRRTLPEFTREGVNQVLLPVNAGDRGLQFELTRPGHDATALSLDALGAESYGLLVRPVNVRGHYWVSASPLESEDAEIPQSTLWRLPIAVNSPEQESNLSPLDELGVRDRLGEVTYRWISPGEPISLEGSAVSGQNFWKWLMSGLLLLLLVELAVLAVFTPGRRQSA
ncbi:MAG: BatA domain-containing protein [Planctomycetales bacterium]